MEVTMITEIQGLPPIVIEDFPELQSSVKKEIEASMVANNSTNKAEKNSNQNPNVKIEKQKIADFSDLSQKVSEIIDENNVVFKFTIDQSTKKMILKLIDSETKEVLQQFPPDIALKIARIVANQLEKGNVTNAKF